MKAINLYVKLEKDFIKKGMSDEWAGYMKPVYAFICDNFKQRSMGLVCDNTEKISKVYTAVFPSKKVMQNILKRNEENLLLFTHHPSIWDIRKAPDVFQLMDKKLLQRFRDRKISIYNLHVPLDNFGKYSTSGTLAKAVGINPETPFGPYFGGLCGVFGKTKLISVKELKKKFQDAVGHNVILYNYGDDKIKANKVAVVAGGGNSIDLLEEIAKAGINTFITGITVKNAHSAKAHEFAEKNKINLLGGTHYSTEQFACIAMCDYFKKVGLPCEFIPDKPVMEDM